MIPRGGVRIGRFRGIEIYLHWSWFIIFFLLLWLIIDYFRSTNPQFSSSYYIPMAVITTFLFFMSVLVHELSHSVIANRNGVPIRRITLFVFGGVAQMSKDVTTPRVEFRMAIAGPLTSYALGIIFIGATAVAAVLGAGTVASGFILLVEANIVLGTFNLIPGFPLDGGRVLRSILWRRSGNLQKSTRTASRFGEGLGILLIVVGAGGVLFYFAAPSYNTIVFGFWFVLIGLFLFQAAVTSYRQVLVRTSLSDMKVRDLMRPGVPAVEASTTLEEVYRLHLQHSPTITVPVLQRGKLWETVNLPALRTVEPSAWPDTPASQVARPLAPEDAIDGEQPLFDAVLLMERADKEFLWVTEEGRLIGVIFREDARRMASQSQRDNQ